MGIDEFKTIYTEITSNINDLMNFKPNASIEYLNPRKKMSHLTPRKKKRKK